MKRKCWLPAVRASSGRSGADERESGGVIVPALLVLLVGGATAAGVASLVSSGKEAGADRSDGERAFFIAESVRLLGCPNEGQEQSLSNGGFLCEESHLCGGRDLIVAWTGSPVREQSLASHTICATRRGGNGNGDVLDEFDPDQTENVTYGDDITVSGGGNKTFRNVAFGNNFQLDGAATFEGEACFGDNADFSGNTNFEADLTGTSLACFGSGASLSGSGGQEDFAGDVFFGPNSSITGNASAGGNVCVAEAEGDSEVEFKGGGTVYYSDTEGYEENCGSGCPADCASQVPALNGGQQNGGTSWGFL